MGVRYLPIEVSNFSKPLQQRVSVRDRKSETKPPTDALQITLARGADCGNADVISNITTKLRIKEIEESEDSEWLSKGCIDCAELAVILSKTTLENYNWFEEERNNIKAGWRLLSHTGHARR